MGANNSTCLPCKVAGAGARRSKATGGLHNPKDGDKHARLLKKVSTAAEPQGGSRTAGQDSTSKGSPTNGAVLSSSQSMQGRTERAQQQLSFQPQEQLDSPFEPTDSQQLQQGAAMQDEQDAQPCLEGWEQQEDGTALSSNEVHSSKVSPARDTSTKEPPSAEEQLAHKEALKHQQHIHVPSHLLATETEASWQQHQDSQQALLSPHSCSVAHRVAAALRAAAGERAAAAAARAAEAVEAAKSVPKETVEQQRELGCQHGSFPSSSLESRALRLASGNTGESSMGQAYQRQGQQRHPSQNSCFPQVSCFTASEDSGNEITVRQSPQQQQMAGTSLSSDYFVVAAAKRVGEMLSTAATAAASMASSAAGKRTCATDGEGVIVSKEQRGFELANREERLERAKMGKEKSSELRESAAVLLGAMDRAMDTINSEDFKKQAVTLLSQSISVAASVVEVVKKCGDAPHSQGVFRQAHLVKGHDETSCAPDFNGYYEALRMSAQQQLSEGAAHPQLSV